MTAVSTSLGRTIEPPAGSDQQPLVAPERSEVETTRFGEWRSGRCGVGCAAESLPVSSELIRERLVDRHGGHVGHLGHDLLQANQRDSVDNTGQCGELVVVFVASVRGDRGSELAALFGKGAGIYVQLLQGGDLLLCLVLLSQPLLHHHACPRAGGGMHGLLLGRPVRGQETAERGEGHLTLVPGRGGHRVEQVSATRRCSAFSNRSMKVNPL